MKPKSREYFGIQRKMVSYITTESWQNVPHVSYLYEPDVTAFYQTYKRLNLSRDAEHKITFNTVVMKAICEGLKAAPIMNAHIQFNRRFVTGKIETFEEINISMPTILPNGEMMTLNLRDFGSKNLDEMTAYIKAIRYRAEHSNLTEAMYTVSLQKTLETLRQGHLLQVLRKVIGANFGRSKVKHLHGKAKRDYEAIPESERLTMKDLEQGTVTISNIGSSYREQRGKFALLDIVPPQVAAFGVGALQDTPVSQKDETGATKIRIRSVLPICIAFDHRALDFGDTVPFQKKMDEIFAHPEVIFTWVDPESLDETQQMYAVTDDET